jgi:hypothetical protein
MEVSAVDQRHVHLRPRELANSLQAGEAATDDNDSMARTLASAQRRNRLRPLHWRGRFFPIEQCVHRHV